jgi:hypothetical protein
MRVLSLALFLGFASCSTFAPWTFIGSLLNAALALRRPGRPRHRSHLMDLWRTHSCAIPLSGLSWFAVFSEAGKLKTKVP